jgi:type II secretory ATPase GspE/PulE/Tfp pilus assembly ATPase PilB-like protein
VGSTASAAAFEPDAHQLLRLSELGFSRRDLALVLELSNAPRGLVVVTGLNGAGKRIVHAMLTQLADASKNIVTIEDTIECTIPGVRHTQIIPSTGFTYAVALRSMLRQYPDVIMVEDIQDPEAAEMALRAAQSGVLVLTTLIEGDASSAIVRLVDMRLEPYLLASYLTGVIAQRLIRLICADCKEPVTYSAEVLEKVGLSRDPDVMFSRGRGCLQCGGTGYRGRTSTYEILVVDSALQALIRERADARAIAQAAADTGMKSLFDDALAKAIFQQTTLEEVVRLTPP